MAAAAFLPIPPFPILLIPSPLPPLLIGPFLPTPLSKDILTVTRKKRGSSEVQEAERQSVSQRTPENDPCAEDQAAIQAARKKMKMSTHVESATATPSSPPPPSTSTLLEPPVQPLTTSVAPIVISAPPRLHITPPATALQSPSAILPTPVLLAPTSSEAYQQQHSVGGRQSIGPAVYPCEPNIVSMRCLFSSKETAVLLGRGGSFVSHLRSSTTARVQISDQAGTADRVVTFAGSPDIVSRVSFFHTFCKQSSLN